MGKNKKGKKNNRHAKVKKESKVASSVEKSETDQLLTVEVTPKKRKRAQSHDIVEPTKKKALQAHPDSLEQATKDIAHDDGSSVTQQASQAPCFPFPTDPDDHCESPLEAYRDIMPILQCLGVSSKLTIYDPYYCNGAVKERLKTLGFPHVYNRKEDCYHVWEKKQFPEYDVLVTNPPYSGDHIERLIKFVTSDDRPWCLLLPTFVHKKDFYLHCTAKLRPFYLVPRKRYVYLPPADFREAKKSDVHKKSSPFVSMWYVWGGSVERNEELIRVAASTKATCQLARSKSALRDLRRQKK